MVERRFALPLTGSVLLHALALAALIYLRAPAKEAYSVTTVSVRLVEAPAGPKQVGVVANEPAKQTPPKAASEAKAPPRETPPTVKAPPKTKTPPVLDAAKTATRVAAPPATKAADTKAETKTAKVETIPDRAGAGDVGGKGSDVIDKTFVGLDFPDPGYLRHIMNRIMANFRNTMPRAAEFEFVIKRDGCLQAAPRSLKGSGSSVFDAEARTAIELASRDCAFTPLPQAWPDDILRIHFKFDPKVIGGK
jgi:outer membrane biosynthesis protein TonB